MLCHCNIVGATRRLLNYFWPGSGVGKACYDGDWMTQNQKQPDLTIALNRSAQLEDRRSSRMEWRVSWRQHRRSGSNSAGLRWYLGPPRSEVRIVKRTGRAFTFLTLAGSQTHLPAIELKSSRTDRDLAARRQFLNHQPPASCPMASKPRTAVLGSGTEIAPMSPFVASAVYPEEK